MGAHNLKSPPFAKKFAITLPAYNYLLLLALAFIVVGVRWGYTESRLFWEFSAGLACQFARP